MKSDWEIKTLGEVCEVSMGKTPPRGNKIFWDVEKKTRNIWVSIADMSATKGVEINDSKEYVSDQGAKLFKSVPKGTLLASFKLSLGKLAFAGTELRTNEAIAALKNEESQVLNTYLYYYLTYFDWDDYAKEDHKVKGKTLNKEKVKAIIIKFPQSFAEQRRIVKILDKKFEAIEKLKKVTEEQLTDARELFESQLDLSFESLIRERDSLIMSDIYDVRDGTHDSPKYQKEGRALVTSKNLKEGVLFLDNVKYISEKDYEDICKRSRVSVGDVLLAMIGTIGNPVVITAEPDYAIKNVALFKVPANQNSDFLRYYLLSNFVKDKMLKESKGATQQFVGLGYLRSFPIPQVDYGEQTKVVKMLDAAADKVRKLEKIYQEKLADLEVLKKSYLEQAFARNL